MLSWMDGFYPYRISSQNVLFVYHGSILHYPSVDKASIILSVKAKGQQLVSRAEGDIMDGRMLDKHEAVCWLCKMPPSYSRM